MKAPPAISVKIGGIDWTVQAGDATWSRQTHALGQCDHEASTIIVYDGQSPGQQAVILLHEILHACFHTFSLKSEELTEEEVCTGLDGPLAAFWRDNPGVVALIGEALRGTARIV